MLLFYLYSALRQDQVTRKRDEEASCIWKERICLDVWHKKEKEGESYLAAIQKINGYTEFYGNYKGKVMLGKGQVMQITFKLDSYFWFVEFVVLCKTVISSVLVCDLCNPKHDMKKMAEPHFDSIQLMRVSEQRMWSLHSLQSVILYTKLKYNIWVQVLLSVLFTENMNCQSKFPPKLNCEPDGNFALLLET